MSLGSPSTGALYHRNEERAVVVEERGVVAVHEQRRAYPVSVDEALDLAVHAYAYVGVGDIFLLLTSNLLLLVK